MYVIVPVAPSSSVTVAVRTWSSVAVPDIATVAASFTLATADVAALVTDSAVFFPRVCSSHMVLWKADRRHLVQVLATSVFAGTEGVWHMERHLHVLDSQHRHAAI